jgi:enoyl-CoA hydratase/carnithine racemase
MSARSLIVPTVDLDREGMQHGRLRVPYSHDRSALLAERKHIAALFKSEDAIEGFTAFIERRKANFSDR